MINFIHLVFKYNVALKNGAEAVLGIIFTPNSNQLN